LAALSVREDPLHVVITSPLTDKRLTGPTPIIGSAKGASFAGYQLQAGQGVSPSTWTIVAKGTSPVDQSVLGTIDPQSFPSGPFTVRLAATSVSGSTYTYQIALQNDFVQFTS